MNVRIPRDEYAIIETRSHSSPHQVLKSARMDIMLRKIDSFQEAAIVFKKDILGAIFECGNYCYCYLQYSSSWAEQQF